MRVYHKYFILIFIIKTNPEFNKHKVKWCVKAEMQLFQLFIVIVLFLPSRYYAHEKIIERGKLSILHKYHERDIEYEHYILISVNFNAIFVSLLFNNNR